jgi:hypothetical protein
MIYTYPTDLNYINVISYRLDGFKQVNNVYNCRCPFCGDSKNKRKQRFYLYTKKGNINANCKNCGYSKSFYNFIKDLDSILFEQYRKDVLLDNFKTNKTKVSVKIEEQKKVLKSIEKIHCKKITELNKDHTAYKYLMSRSLENHLDKFFYTDDFKSVASELNLESSINLKENEPRIIIPFYDENNKIKAIQGRSLDPKSKLRYITIKASNDNDKIYGIERLDFEKPIYVVEGPIDSLFVDNCVATCDSNLLACSFGDVYIFDNQCRNKELIAIMERSISLGKSIVIWPNSSDSKQDINDLIKNGVSEKMLMEVFRKRTFSGIRAKLELSKWRKV